MMSAERWESVTWDLIEREIVDHLLIANDRPVRKELFPTLMAKGPKTARVPRKESKRQRRSSSNG